MPEALKKRRRGRKLSGPMQDFIQAKALEGWNGKQIYDYLSYDTPDEGDEYKRLGIKIAKDETQEDNIPGLRKIQRIVKDITSAKREDTSEVWRPDDEATNPEDVRCVLDVLHAVTVHIEGIRAIITRQEAGKVARLSKAMPHADPWLIWQVTQLYLAYESKGQSTVALDTFLAFKPWQDDCLNAYLKAIEEGIILPVPLIFWLLGGPGWAKVAELDAANLTTDELQMVTGGEVTSLEHIKANAKNYIAVLKKMEAFRKVAKERGEQFEATMNSTFEPQKFLLDKMEEVLQKKERISQLAEEERLKGNSIKGFIEEQDRLTNFYTWLEKKYEEVTLEAKRIREEMMKKYKEEKWEAVGNEG